MTLRDIFRDVVSRLNIKDFDQEMYYLDVVQAINDAIATQRVQYVMGGRGEFLSVTEDVEFTYGDTFYPEFAYGTLSSPLLDTPNIEQAILNGVAWETDNVVGEDSFDVGDFAVKDRKLYECVSPAGVSDTQTFEPSAFRNFREDDRLHYKVGDVIQNDGQFYEVQEDFKNINGQDFADSARFLPVYWRLSKRSAYTVASFYNVRRISELNYVPTEFPAFTVRGNMIYASKNVPVFTITYVPEWQKVEDLDDELNLPPDMLGPIKQQAMESLQNKIGVTNEQR